MHRQFEYIANNAPERRTIEIVHPDPGVGPWSVLEVDGGWSVHSSLIDGALSAGRPWRQWLDAFHSFLADTLRADEGYAHVNDSLQALVRYAPAHESARGLLSGGLWLLGQADTASAERAHRQWATGDLPLLESCRLLGAIMDAQRVTRSMRVTATGLEWTPNRINFMQASDPAGEYVERIIEKAEICWTHESILRDEFDAGFITGAQIGINLAIHHQTHMREIGGGWALSWSQQQTFEVLAVRERAYERVKTMHGG
ncbi:MAG: hypothetical protein AB7E55_17885 [Pigmentiphaga sp.]